MKYRLLGNSSLRVSEVALGTMTFGEDWGWGAPKEEAQKVYDAFRDAGGNFIDTANVYTNGASETFVARIFHTELKVGTPRCGVPAPCRRGTAVRKP